MDPYPSRPGPTDKRSSTDFNKSGSNEIATIQKLMGNKTRTQSLIAETEFEDGCDDLDVTIDKGDKFIGSNQMCPTSRKIIDQ
jgi:hypothetical protein